MHPKQIENIRKVKKYLAEQLNDGDPVTINGLTYYVQKPGNRISILGFECADSTYWLETPADVDPYWSLFKGNVYVGMQEYGEIADLPEFIEEKLKDVQRAELKQLDVDAEYRRSRLIAKINDWIAYLKTCLWKGHNFTIAPTWLSAVILCERCNKPKIL